MLSKQATKEKWEIRALKENTFNSHAAILTKTKPEWKTERDNIPKATRTKTARVEAAATLFDKKLPQISILIRKASIAAQLQAAYNTLTNTLLLPWSQCRKPFATRRAREFGSRELLRI